MRRCQKYYCLQEYGCLPIQFSELIGEYDIQSKNNCRNQKCLDKRFIKRCHQKCPQNCVSVDYSHNKYIMFANHKNDETLTRIPVYWDSNTPLIHYKETALMSFTEYLCICGGYFGLFFGFNAQQLFIGLINAMKPYLSKFIIIYIMVIN